MRTSRSPNASSKTSWIDFWKGADREAARSALKAARSGGIGRFVGFFPTTQSRKPMWFDVAVSPILDAAGKPEKLLAASRDVTQWKRAENLLHAIVDGHPPPPATLIFAPFCKGSRAD